MRNTTANYINKPPIVRATLNIDKENKNTDIKDPIRITPSKEVYN